MVPSRAVSVRVKLGGVDTLPVIAVDGRLHRVDVAPAGRRRPGRRRWPRAGAASRGSTRGLSAPTRLTNVSRCARASLMERGHVGADRCRGGGERGGGRPGCRRRRATGSAWSNAASRSSGRERPPGAEPLEDQLARPRRACPRRSGARRSGRRSAARAGGRPARSSTRLATRPGDPGVARRSSTPGSVARAWTSSGDG